MRVAACGDQGKLLEALLLEKRVFEAKVTVSEQRNTETQNRLDDELASLRSSMDIIRQEMPRGRR